MPLFKTSTDSIDLAGEAHHSTRSIFTRNRLMLILGVLALALSVRVLTLMFMRAHLNDAGWFQFGSYSVFDRQARAVLGGQQSLFLISDPSRTDQAQYPPAYPAWVAVIYKITGNHSAYSVQIVQWTIDFILSLLLITGITVTAFGWRAAFWSSVLVGLSPLLALYAAYPSADIPTAWFVLGGNWLLLLSAKRSSVWFALGGGVLLGVACWLRVNPLYLCVGWAAALLLFSKANLKRRAIMSAAVLIGTVLVISPIVIRNFLSFPDFTPTGGTIGANLWEGLGETELGRKNGFEFGDDKLVERERIKMGLPADFKIEAQWPDGIRRDRERVRESLNFIKQHPIWYAGVMIKRMWGMLKVAGAPLPYYGTSGINVTAKKCLPEKWQGGVIALGVNALGMIQSVSRYLLLPLVAFGVFIAFRRDSMVTGILLVTVVYYLVPGTVGHTEIRYMLPLHAVLIVFGGVGVRRLTSLVWNDAPK
jgi:hypothetical protein